MKGMMKTALAVAVMFSAPAQAAEFKDPVGDDKGPGTYLYPTNKVYKSGSFDIVALRFAESGGSVQLELEQNSDLEDEWGMGKDFAVQTAFVFLDTDGDAGNGHSESVPGLNVVFEDGHSWDKVVVISPQPASVLERDAKGKARDIFADMVFPQDARGQGRAIVASFPVSAVGNADFAKWRVQVAMQSNEGFPARKDYFTRKVNEFEGEHRFGGGWDTNCDPHIVDVLAGDADASADEADAQYEMLSYECESSGKSKRRAALRLVSGK